MPAKRSIQPPAQFRYREVYLKGRPEHTALDAFGMRHPKMDVGKRAKIFAPFAALRGFDEEVSAKEVRYEAQRELSAEDAQELSRRLAILQHLTRNSRAARAQPVTVSVTFFVPCADQQNEAFGRLGQYRTVTGVCRRVDEVARTVLVENQKIPFGCLQAVEGQDPELFRADPI